MNVESRDERKNTKGIKKFINSKIREKRLRIKFNIFMIKTFVII